jgi:molybdate transport system ATP-binding protein
LTLHLDLTASFSDRPELRVKADLRAPCTGIFGPSGAGKTTLLRAVAGFPTRARGTITWKGKTLLRPDGSLAIPPEERRFAIVSQPTHLFPHLSVHEQVHLAARYRPRSAPELDPEQILVDFELTGRESHRPGELSGGEGQRLALARAIASAPELLLLDEAFTALDVERRARLIRVTQEYLHRLQMACLIVSHDARLLQALAPETLVLSMEGAPRLGPSHQILSEAHQVAFNVFSVVVHASERPGLHRLEAEGCTLFSTATTLSENVHATVSISTADIIVSKGEPGLVSARNAIPVRFCAAEPLQSARLRLFTETEGGTRFFVDLSNDAWEELAVGAQDPLYLLIKANRVEHIA